MIMESKTPTKESMLGYEPESQSRKPNVSGKKKEAEQNEDNDNDNDQTRDAAASATFDSSELRVSDNTSVGPHDVLLGRGGATNSHTGNRSFRKVVALHQQEYLKAKKREKVVIAQRIVAIVKGNGGRFLKRTDNALNWIEVTDKRAQEKTSQALREGLDVRNKTVRPSKMIKEVRPTPPHDASPTQPREPVTVRGGQVVQINVPKFSPTSAVSHLIPNVVVPSGGAGSAMYLPQLSYYASKSPPQLMNPVPLHYNLPVFTQKDIQHLHEV